MESVNWRSETMSNVYQDLKVSQNREFIYKIKKNIGLQRGGMCMELKYKKK